MVIEKNEIKNYINKELGEKMKANREHQLPYFNAATVVFGVHLSAQAAFRLDRKSPAILNRMNFKH